MRFRQGAKKRSVRDVVRSLFLPSLTALGLFVIATHNTVRLYDLPDLLLLLGVYACLGSFVHGLYRSIVALPGPTRPAGALFLACVILAWLRYHTDHIWFFRKPVLCSGIFLGLLLLFLLLSRVRDEPPRLGSTLGATALKGGLWVVVTLLLLQTSESVRWHVFQHNRLLFTALHHAGLAPRVGIDEALRGVPVLAEATGSTAGEASSPIEREAEGPRPSVVFVMIDTLRADALAPWGSDRESMPDLSRLADRSHAFMDVWANASWTRPSIATFFTGLLPEEAGVMLDGDRLSPDLKTVAEVYREQGYRTAAFVTNTHVGRNAGFDQGFDVFEEFEHAGPYARAEEVKLAVSSWASAGSSDGKGSFLYVHLMEPHTPYRNGGLGLLEPKRSRRAYRNELVYLDAHLSEMIGRLREVLGSDTTVIVTSDHGEEFGDHGDYGHGHSLYRELLWIPLIVSTGDEAGSRLSEKLDARDVHDLLCAMAISPRALDVRDWARSARRDRRYASSYAEPAGSLPSRLAFPFRAQRLRGVEQDGYFLIWSGYGPTWELYDTDRDPWQRTNVATAHPEKVEALRAALDDAVRYRRAPQKTEHTLQELERLRDLGYVN
jgi:arylsulfatase A-like enzyme